jgi:hypothetical protein
MKEVSAGQMIWPTRTGDHRASSRTSARGAVHGRVRWRVPVPGIWCALVDARGRIVALSSTRAQVLDAAGSLVASFEIPGAEPAPIVTSAGLVASTGSELVALDLDGATRWRTRSRGDVALMHASPDGALVVWTKGPRKGIDVPSEITRYGPDGEELWSTVHTPPARGYVYSWSLAFDDGGRLFALAGGRLGDGVSGDDIPTGGVSCYDPAGQLAWTISDQRNISRELRGLQRGAALVGMEARAYDERGATQWTTAGDATPPTVRLAGLDLELFVPLVSRELPLLSRTAPGINRQINEARDGDGNRTFIHREQVVCVDADLNLRWTVPVARANDWYQPVIGPDRTVLVPSEDGLLTCIE